MENYRDAIERVELRYSQVRQLLMEKGVPTIHFSFYRSFGLYVDKLCRDHAGETLRSGVEAATARAGPATGATPRFSRQSVSRCFD